MNYLNIINGCYTTIVLQSDSEFGTHVYYKDYKNEISFETDNENIKDIIKEIESRTEK